MKSTASKIVYVIMLLLLAFMNERSAEAEKDCGENDLSLRCYLSFYLSEIEPALQNPASYAPSSGDYLQLGRHNMYELAIVNAYRALGMYQEAKRLYPEILDHPGPRTIEYLIHQGRYDEAINAFGSGAGEKTYDMDKCTAAMQTFSHYGKLSYVRKLLHEKECLQHAGNALFPACHFMPPGKLVPVIKIAVEKLDEGGLDENTADNVYAGLHQCYKTLLWLKVPKDVIEPVDFPLWLKWKDFFEKERAPPMSQARTKTPVLKICTKPVTQGEIDRYKKNFRATIGDKTIEHLAECAVAHGAYDAFLKHRTVYHQYDMAVTVVHAFRDAMMKGHYDLKALKIMDHMTRNTSTDQGRDQFENAVLVGMAIGMQEALTRKYWPKQTDQDEARQLAKALENYRGFFEFDHHLERFDHVIFFLYWRSGQRSLALDFAERYPSVKSALAIQRMLAEGGAISPEEAAEKIKRGYDLRETINPLLDCRYRPDICKEKLPVALRISRLIKDPVTRYLALTRILDVLTHIEHPFHAIYYRPLNSGYPVANDFER